MRAGDTRPARRLRLVSLIVLGLSLSGLGVAQLLGATVPVVAYVAVPLLILGLTLVVATWLGRARGLLPAAVLLAIAVLGVSTAQAIPAVLAAAPRSPAATPPLPTPRPAATGSRPDGWWSI